MQMDELNKQSANAIRAFYLSWLIGSVNRIRQNYNEMDFSNAKQKSSMETTIQEAEALCYRGIAELQNMTFE